MGFGFRKSFGYGPFRFTASPGGLSSSFGLTGARISSGPRGTFVTVSSHGAYYRHRIDSGGQHTRQRIRQPQIQDSTESDPLFQVPISELVGSNQCELVMKLNENVSAKNPAFLLVGLSCIALLLIPSFPTAASIFAISGLLLSIFIWRSFKANHTHEIHYALDELANERFVRQQHALADLASCSRVWFFSARSAISDLKRNAGAETLISRKPVRIGTLQTKGFKSSLPISSIEADQIVFHFLLDQILLFSANRYASLGHDQLSVDLKATGFIEEDTVPHDTQQVDTTWRYVNKSGGPDRRFSNNRQIPIVRYGELQLRTQAGLNVILQTSNVEKGQAFVSIFADQSQKTSTQSSSPTGNASGPVPRSLLQCYAILGIARPTTLELAAAAHRQQASLYHPDKYEHLAPEMKTLASAKMAEINAAYSRIKEDLNR